MKTLRLNILLLLLISGLCGIFSNAYSQDVKLNRQERKELKKAQRAANFQILDSLLNARRFVLEADYLQNKYGDRIPVFSSLNFIKVDGLQGVLQTGSTKGMGYNSVGGVTAEGNISLWKVHKNTRNLSYTLEFSILTAIGHYDVLLTVSSENFATATITGLGPGSLTWEGHLETLDNSRIFKGHETV
jgi:hypothetical protein